MKQTKKEQFVVHVAAPHRLQTLESCSLDPFGSVWRASESDLVTEMSDSSVWMKHEVLVTNEALKNFLSLPGFVPRFVGLHFICLAVDVSSASLGAASCLTVSPFITASPRDLHDFNPPPWWALIPSVKLQISVQSAVKAAVPDPFQLFCNLIWCRNDDPPRFHTEYRRGVQHTRYEPNFQVASCWDEFSCC